MSSDNISKIEYMFNDPYQLEYLLRGAESYKNDVEVIVLPLDTPEQIQSAAEEWSNHEEHTYHNDEDAFDYIRRTDRRSFEKLVNDIPQLAATRFLTKVVIRNKTPDNSFELLREYYMTPSNKRPEDESHYGQMWEDLRGVFGGDGVERLCHQIAHDNTSLDKKEVVAHAWSLISEATASMQSATKEDMTKHAILIHERREAFRRIAQV